MTETARTTVLITGAGGFVGSAVADALEAAGYIVRRGVRRTGGVPCDLDKPDQVAAAMAGVDCVVHAAYGDATRMEQQCRTLLEAMTSCGVPRLIYLSSIAVYGAAQGQVDEQTPLTALDGYAAGKIACERAVTGWFAEDEGRRCALILRPGIIYGRSSPFWIEKMAERIRLGAWGTFGPAGEGSAALVHVDDIAGLIGHAIARDCTPNAGAPVVMNVVGPDTPSWNVYFSELAKALGQGTLPVIEGANLATRQALSTGAKIWRKLGLPGAAALALAPTQGEIALFARKAGYRTGAMTAFGFKPSIGLAEGLARSVAQPKA